MFLDTSRDALPAAPARKPPVKAWAHHVLERIGLRRPIGHLHLALRRWGLAPWAPLVPEQQFSTCVDNALTVLRKADPAHEFGDYLEFGVSRGTSLAAVYHSLQRGDLPRARLIGFDSFAGMPPESAGQGWDPGAFASPIGITRRYLVGKGVDLERVTLVKGWFSDTLNERTRSSLKLDKASLIMVDCDIYSASCEALRFSAPHIGDRAIVIFDDWGWREQEGERGQKEAFAEFLTEHPDLSAEPLPSYLEQARVFLLTRSTAVLKVTAMMLSSILGFELVLETA
jgi:hypothetical protein